MTRGSEARYCSAWPEPANHRPGSIVGLPLLDRSKRSVHLTPTGNALFEDAVKIVAQADATLAQLKRLGRGETGRITIGYVASAAYSGILTDSLGSFRRGLPDIELSLIELEMRQQLEKIRLGELDFGYIRPPAIIPPELNATTVLREPLVAALSVSHPLASKASVRLSDLQADLFITPRQPADIGFHATRWMHAARPASNPGSIPTDATLRPSPA